MHRPSWYEEVCHFIVGQPPLLTQEKVVFQHLFELELPILADIDLDLGLCGELRFAHFFTFVLVRQPLNLVREVAGIVIVRIFLRVQYRVDLVNLGFVNLVEKNLFKFEQVSQEVNSIFEPRVFFAEVVGVLLNFIRMHIVLFRKDVHQTSM